MAAHSNIGSVRSAIPSAVLRHKLEDCMESVIRRYKITDYTSLGPSINEIELLLLEIMKFFKEYAQSSNLKSIIGNAPQIGQLISLICHRKIFQQSPRIFQNLMKCVLWLHHGSRNLANRFEIRTYRWCQKMLTIMMTAMAEDFPRSSVAWESYEHVADINDLHNLMTEAILQALRGQSDAHPGKEIARSCPRSLVNYGNALLRSTSSAITTNELITEILMSVAENDPPIGIVALCEESSRRINAGMLNLPAKCLRSLALLHTPFLERELLDLLACCVSASCGDMEEYISSSWIPIAAANNQRLFVFCSRIVHQCFIRSRCSPFIAKFMEFMVKAIQKHCELLKVYPNHLAHLVLLLQIPVTGMTDALRLLHTKCICKTMISSIENHTCSKEEASVLLYHFPVWFQQLLTASVRTNLHQVDELTSAMATNLLMRLSQDSPACAFQKCELS